MEDDVVLGEVTCSSGELVLMDGGYLGLWSGNRSPDETGDRMTCRRWISKWWAAMHERLLNR